MKTTLGELRKMITESAEHWDAGTSPRLIANDMANHLNELEGNVTGAQAETALNKLWAIVDYLNRQTLP